ncbi:uncharacterized protein [Eleutherodactylus coqui]|uniref:uncharacterized protein n=1 Tax=Eleutherodactylus coqui TaxID=57060 RepID=UPI003462C908
MQLLEKSNCLIRACSLISTCDPSLGIHEDYLSVQPGYTKKRSVNVTLTSSNNFTFEDGYSQITEQLKSAPPEVPKLFDKRTSEMHVPTMESGNSSALFIARFTYVANITIITYLNDELVKELQMNTTRRKRSTAEIRISNVTDNEKLSVQELAKSASCGYAGYEVNPESLLCVSKCVDNTYCLNGAACHLSDGNITCSCKPFSIYITSGPRCEDLSMNLGAFFGILFGTLAFLLLLFLGIGLGLYYYRKSKQNDADIDDEMYQKQFNWKPSIFSPFSRLEETEVPNLYKDTKAPHLVSWKPHLEKVNSLIEVKIKRPEIKNDLATTEIQTK